MLVARLNRLMTTLAENLGSICQAFGIDLSGIKFSRLWILDVDAKKILMLYI